MDSKLKLCPFCGGEADAIYKPSPSGDWWQAGCKKCFISTRHYLHRKQAIAAWNTRAELTCEGCIHDLPNGMTKDLCLMCSRNAPDRYRKDEVE